jgi:hypothetical protein
MRSIMRLTTLTSLLMCLGACTSAADDGDGTAGDAAEVNEVKPRIQIPLSGSLVGRKLEIKTSTPVRVAFLTNLRTHERADGQVTETGAKFDLPESFVDGDDLEITTPVQQGLVVRLWNSGKPGVVGIGATGLEMGGLKLVEGKLHVKGAALFYESIEGQGGSRVGLAAIRIVDLQTEKARIEACHLAGGCAGGGARLVMNNDGALRAIDIDLAWDIKDNEKEFAIGQLDASGHPIHFGCFKVLSRLGAAISISCPEGRTP